MCHYLVIKVVMHQYLTAHRNTCFFVVIVFRLTGSELEEDGPWKLYFKLYCFLDVESMPKEGVEFVFMFEQVSHLIQSVILEQLYYESRHS